MCGKVHTPHFHSYPYRRYRCPESLEDVRIRVPVIFCKETKSSWKQHYKRLLPDFLIPYARMRLDRVVEAAERRESGSTLEECCRIIGCRDLRTVRMHQKRLGEAAKVVSLVLAERQAAAVHLYENTYQSRPLSPFQRLEELYELQEEGRFRAGDGQKPAYTLRQMLQAALGKKSRKISTSYVSRPPPRPCYTS